MSNRLRICSYPITSKCAEAQRQTPSLGGSPTRWEQAWPQIITKKTSTNPTWISTTYNWCGSLDPFQLEMLSTQELPFLRRSHWQDALIWMHLQYLDLFGCRAISCRNGDLTPFCRSYFSFQAIMKEWNVGSKQSQKSRSLAVTQIPNEQ